MRIVAPLLALTLGVVALLLGSTPSVASDGEIRPNVLLITVDTLRADRLSAYGYVI